MWDDDNDNNRKKKKSKIIAIALHLFLLMMMLMLLSTSSAAPPLIFAQTAATTISSSNIGVGGSNSCNITMGMMVVLNLGTPLFIDRATATSITNLTWEIIRTTFKGNGTFMLPLPTGRNVSTVDLGHGLTNTTWGLARRSGLVSLKTMAGKESALNFVEFQPVNSTMTAIGIGYIQNKLYNRATISTNIIQ